MKKEKSCGAIIINENKILVVKQKSGFYGFPKGHIEKNETEKITAIREVKEETNIDIEIDDNLRFSISYLVNGNINKEVVYFVGYPKNTNIKIQEQELESAQWIELEKVEEILTFDNLKELWRKVLKEISKK